MRRFILTTVIALFVVSVWLYAQEKDTAQGEPKVKLELIEEKDVDLDVQMEIALMQGKSFVIGDKKTVIFFSKNKHIFQEIQMPDHAYPWCDVYSSSNGKFIGIRYLPYGEFGDNADRFIFFDSLGIKIWELYRKDDKGILWLPPSPPYTIKVNISNDGSRIVVFKDTEHLPYYKATKLYFYDGRDGSLRKVFDLPHPYTWSAGWTPNSEMFIVTTPGDTPGGISKNDVIYAFDKNGNELWKYIAEGKHFIPSDPGKPCFVFTDRIIGQSYYEGVIFVDQSGRLLQKFEPIVDKKGGGFIMSNSLTGNFIVVWEDRVEKRPTYVYLLDGIKGGIIWQWQWEETQGLPEIVKCVFSKNDSLIAAFAFGGGKRWVFLFDVKTGFLAKTELPTFTRETTIDIDFVASDEIIVVAHHPKKYYKIKIKSRED
ncbi:MAG: hypothetical protein ABIL70_07760 [candidate division WOR-3 bacterium]